MKKLLFVVIAIALVCACTQEKKTAKPAAVKADIKIEDTTIYGKCIGAANYTIQIQTVTSDSLEFYIPEDTLEDNRIVLGGLFEEDQYAILGYKDADNQHIANKVINLTTLMGSWAYEATGTSLKLDEDLTWIMNGKIISNKDTFSIYDLSSDTLTVENKDGIIFLSRQK